MEPAFTPAPSAVNHFLSPTEQQQLAAAGITQALLAGLLRAFLTALLTSLPGLIGTTGAPTSASPTKVGK